jgi:hypothetical protein
MSDEKTFEPITTQEEFDERIKARLAREKEKWEKESGSADLKAELQSKDEEIAEIKRNHFQEAAQRDVRAELANRGVTDEGRISRIMKLIDFSEASDSSFAVAQIDGVAKDLPELVRPRGAGSGGSSKPVLGRTEKPLTEEDIAKMTPEEMAKPSVMQRIDAFMSGQR